MLRGGRRKERGEIQTSLDPGRAKINFGFKGQFLAPRLSSHFRSMWDFGVH